MHNCDRMLFKIYIKIFMLSETIQSSDNCCSFGVSSKTVYTPIILFFLLHGPQHHSPYWRVLLLFLLLLLLPFCPPDLNLHCTTIQLFVFLLQTVPETDPILIFIIINKSSPIIHLHQLYNL